MRRLQGKKLRKKHAKKQLKRLLWQRKQPNSRRKKDYKLRVNGYQRRSWLRKKRLMQGELPWSLQVWYQQMMKAKRKKNEEVELWLEIKRKRIRSSNRLMQMQKQTLLLRIKTRLKKVVMKLKLIQQQLLYNQNLKQRHQLKQQQLSKRKKRRKKNLMIGKMPSMMLRID